MAACDEAAGQGPAQIVVNPDFAAGRVQEPAGGKVSGDVHIVDHGLPVPGIGLDVLIDPDTAECAVCAETFAIP